MPLSPELRDDVPVNLNVSSAADACKVNRRVIEKHLKAGDFPNAYYSGEGSRGVWMIPLDDLRAVGLEADAGWLRKHQRFRRQ